mgnify:CR=1 FL=1
MGFEPHALTNARMDAKLETSSAMTVMFLLPEYSSRSTLAESAREGSRQAKVSFAPKSANCVESSSVKVQEG